MKRAEFVEDVSPGDAGKDSGGRASRFLVARHHLEAVSHGAARVKLPLDDSAAGDLEVRRVETHLLDAHAEHGPVCGEDDVVDDGRARRGRGRGRAERARKIASLARVVQRLLGAGRGRGVVQFQLLVVRWRDEPRGRRLGDARYVRHASRGVWAPPALATSDRRFSVWTTREIRTGSTWSDARDGCEGVAPRALDRRTKRRTRGGKTARARANRSAAGRFKKAMLTKNGAWRDVVVREEAMSSSDAPLEISRLPRARRHTRRPRRTNARERALEAAMAKAGGLKLDGRLLVLTSAVWVAGLLVVVFGISANRAEQSGNKLIDFGYLGFLFKRINPYMFAAFGIAFAIGFSVLGAAWCVPPKLKSAPRDPPFPLTRQTNPKRDSMVI